MHFCVQQKPVSFTIQKVCLDPVVVAVAFVVGILVDEDNLVVEFDVHSFLDRCHNFREVLVEIDKLKDKKEEVSICY